MKFKFLALALSLSLLSLSEVSAKEIKFSDIQKKALLKKSKSANFTFYSASETFTENTFITLVGSPTATFVQLPFTQNIHKNGKGIKADSKGQVFHLSKGEYLVTFSGTFEVEFREDVRLLDFGVLFDVALQLGSSFVFINTDSHNLVNNIQLNAFDDTIGVSSISQIVRVKEDLDLSIVARCKTANAFLFPDIQSLSIVKLK
jgi:hypothetical protein